MGEYAVVVKGLLLTHKLGIRCLNVDHYFLPPPFGLLEQSGEKHQQHC